MILLAHASDDDAKSSAHELVGLGRSARRLLEECVEHAGVRRKALSTTTLKLEEAGFVFVRDCGDVFNTEFAIAPTLLGEEALEALEDLEEAGGRPST